MNTYKENLLKAKTILGTFDKVGSMCGVSGKAVMKWADQGRPPRTEYSGETRYAEIISAAVNGAVTKEQLLPTLKPRVERRKMERRRQEQRDEIN